MLRTCSRFIALTAMVAGPSMTAHAADTTLTLACQGTATSITMEDAKPEPVSMGIILNFTKNTVQGFGYLLGYPPQVGDFPVKITGVNEVTVAFDGSESGNQVNEESIRGTIGRVTGDMNAISTSFNLKTRETLSSTSYTLKCRPTQRMF